MTAVTVCVIVLFAIVMFTAGRWSIKALLWICCRLFRAFRRRQHYRLTDEGPADPLKRKDTW